MHYLATMVANNNPELLNLPDQFAFLAKLEQYRTKEVLDQVLEHQKAIRKLTSFKDKIESKLEDMVKLMQAAKDTPAESSDEDEIEGTKEAKEEERSSFSFEETDEMVTARSVLRKLERFLKEAQTRYDNLVDLVATLDKSWRSTAAYFGEKSVGDSVPSSPTTDNDGGDAPAKQQQQQQMVAKLAAGPRKPPEEIFAVLHEFFRHFREAHLQNEDILIREKRQAAIAKRMAASSSPRGSSYRRTPTPALTDSSTAPSTPSSSSLSSAPFLSAFSKLP